MDNKKLAELLFPNIDKTPEYYEEMYPKRNLPEGAKVTRLGPSPTGFIHLGNLYGAFVDERLAHQSEGVFFLRIEDTDDKREVEGAVEIIINSLRFFGINFDEGATMEGDKGAYGDYTQSHRGPIYQCFAKKLVEEGKAYPCFLTEEEIAEIREQQQAIKANPGIYGKWARSRELSYEEIEAKINAGEKFVVRLKSDGNLDLPEDQIRRIKVQDAIRGTLDMPENDQDTVILKQTGIPTYHFAHVVDDHLMRTTHVVRGAEWLPSLPIHVELFEKLGWETPIYCHTAQLMKLDEEGNKRKLSKRLDPELSLDYYRKEGYHPAAVREYLLTILNSNFEEWRIANPDADIEEFQFTTEKMSNSGALFDLNKLNDVSKEVLLKISASDLYDFLKAWAEEFRPEDEGVKTMLSDRAYLEKILDIGRHAERNPRKDHIYADQMVKNLSYFFDETFEIEDEMPQEVVNAGDVSTIIEKYLETYDHSDDNETWFNKIRAITDELGYAVKPKDYKKHPEEYKGHVGHVSTVIRVALMGRQQSPDIWEIQQILGEERTRARLEKFA
ncbi:MAG: glutamate--tRNA ligase [Firmicutes bacterium]|nr:glutamate--tRNA ligase [Bacillota bacterium]MBR3183654.1 glutamate--tRNA ligase [Bacillota bacterium]MBR3374796.1 glutamate--tRNA ligase [Bacillota bacterium]MBR6225378.1 glutamate--tRNA ligase [Bacillota bacterium]